MAVDQCLSLERWHVMGMWLDMLILEMYLWCSLFSFVNQPVYHERGGSGGISGTVNMIRVVST